MTDKRLVTITEEYYKSLLIDQENLNRLEGAGVDNWCGYDMKDEGCEQPFHEWQEELEEEELDGDYVAFAYQTIIESGDWDIGVGMVPIDALGRMTASAEKIVVKAMLDEVQAQMGEYYDEDWALANPKECLVQCGINVEFAFHGQ